MPKKKQTPSPTLFDCLEEITDIRDVRGIRHPLSSVLKLIMLGLICHQKNFTSIASFAKEHWESIKDSLGFTRTYAPHLTTLERHLQYVSIAQLQQVLHAWIIGIAENKQLTASVDAKWIKQSTDEKGNPLLLLTVFEQNLSVALQAYPMHKRIHEPTVFKEFLQELCSTYPQLNIFTFDAIYAQRDLCSTLVEMGKHYVVRIKKNQPETYELIDRMFPKRKDILENYSTLEKKRGVLSDEHTTKTQKLQKSLGK
jgi:hypothetical protein